MEFVIVSAAALLASALTLFSGFGLGTLLMPVVAVFFPLELAIAMTAIVHLANNLFKIGLLGRQANKSVVLHFGLPAVVAAFFGAALLNWLSGINPVYEYEVLGRLLQITIVKLVVGLLILAFVLLELSSWFAHVAVERRWLPLGGAISGFFGGLSGHQGAFRSMFLLKTGLDKEAFIATGVVLAVMVDVSRMIVYGLGLTAADASINWPLVASASMAAFAGAYLSARLLRKVTIKAIQRVVSLLLIIVALGLMSGLL